MILRLEVDNCGLTLGWLYDNGQEVYATSGQSMAEVAKSLDQKLKSNWQSITGIYLFRGPAGYSRLRSTHSFALALKLALDIPLQPYVHWQTKWLRCVPKDSNTVKPIYQS
jgi:tRNA A37 threonylcarbamoyladenosine modification protein TsaB